MERPPSAAKAAHGLEFALRNGRRPTPAALPEQRSCRYRTCVCEWPQARTLPDFSALRLQGRSRFSGRLAAGKVGRAATAAEIRESDLAGRISFGPRWKFDEPPSSSNQIPYRPSFERCRKVCAPMQTLRHRCAAFACGHSASRAIGGIQLNPPNESGTVQMNNACGGNRFRTMLERTFRGNTTIPDYSTQQVRRIANIVLSEDVSGEDASAVLLALIFGTFERHEFYSNPTGFSRGPSACRPSAEGFLPSARPADSNAGCDLERSLRANAAHRTCRHREPEGDILLNVRSAAEMHSCMPGSPEIPPRSCPRCTPDLRRNLRSNPASVRSIPVMKSGPANSGHGYPKCAATYCRDALSHAAMRSNSPGGINRSLRKRRRERSFQSGNQPLFRISKGYDMITDEQMRNRGLRQAQPDDSADGLRSSENSFNAESARSGGKSLREPTSQKRIRAFVWDASKQDVTDRTRRVAAWETAPIHPEEPFKGLDSKFRSDIKSVEHLHILDRPSSEIVKPRVSAHAENKLTLWLPFDTPLSAYWAAESALGRYSMNAVKIDDRIGRIIITSDEAADYGYTPFIKRSFTAKDKRAKAIRPSETKHFLHYLQYASAKRTGDAAQDEFELKLMFTVSNCQEIQFRASEELIRHADSNGFLQRPLEEAFEDLKELWDALRTGRRPFCPPTRWDVITMLREKGHLLPADKKHSALRPILSSATFGDIARILENTRLCPIDAIRSSSRTSEAVRARYIAAHVMRWATSKSVAQIGHALGERDHSSVVHGLKQIDAWAKDRPVNARFLDMFCRLADNVGICNALRSDPGMKKRLANIPPLARSSQLSG